MKHIGTRAQFPELLNESGLNGTWAEVGVAKGQFSKILIEGKPKKLYLVDRWGGDRGHGDAEFNLVMQRKKEAPAGMVEVARADAIEFAKFAEGAGRTFDFVYLDCYAHTGQLDGTIIEAWFPLVKGGGIFAIHDYEKTWPKNIEAIDRFFRGIGRHGDLRFTDLDPYPSAWVVV